MEFCVSLERALLMPFWFGVSTAELEIAVFIVKTKFCDFDIHASLKSCILLSKILNNYIKVFMIL